MSRPLMPKATAVWLVDNTALTFEQIAEFCGLHPLEVQGIADGEVAMGIQGQDPIVSGQLTREELVRCENDKAARLQLASGPGGKEPERRSKGPRYTPVSKRQERPNAIAWLVRYHPELTDAQVSKLVGTTKPTIQSIRDRSHWNISNITPQDPVTLGLCSQVELDSAVQKARARVDREKAREEKEREKRRAANLAAAEEAGMPSAQPVEEEPPAEPAEPTPAEPEPESGGEDEEGERPSDKPLSPEDVFRN
ncbi:MAG TPA: cell cycle transcriptional regulator TrcR [Alphaproteobacteria bacterium]|nr:cell cycle transcriptional regulator TrcR [Alphaproteobacteria bacterium]